MDENSIFAYIRKSSTVIFYFDIIQEPSIDMTRVTSIHILLETYIISHVYFWVKLDD